MLFQRGQVGSQLRNLVRRVHQEKDGGWIGGQTVPSILGEGDRKLPLGEREVIGDFNVPFAVERREGVRLDVPQKVFPERLHRGVTPQLAGR